MSSSPTIPNENILPVIQNIRTIRKLKGISQESVAYDLGIDYSTYGKIERGQITLTVDRLEKIAKILNVGIESLYKWHENTSSSIDEECGPPLNKSGGDKLLRYQLELESSKREISRLQLNIKEKEKIISRLESRLIEGQ